MEATILTKVVLPIALAVIMLGMGLSLTVADFRRVLRAPKAFAIGALCQLVILPALGFGLAHAFSLPPLLAVGLVILALSPGGTTSNMSSYLARGDLALSISLTAVISLITPFTIPIFASLAMSSFMGESQAIALPIGQTIATLFAITVVPVVIGMLLRKKWPAFSARTESPLKWLSIFFLFAIVAGVAKQNWAALPDFFAQTGWAAFALNASAMLAGYAVASLARLNAQQSVTISIEVGIQNGTTALFVTSTLLANPTMSIAPAVYSLIMFATGAAVALARNIRAPRPLQAPAQQV